MHGCGCPGVSRHFEVIHEFSDLRIGVKLAAGFLAVVLLTALLGAMALGMPIAFALLACGVALMLQLDMFDAQILAQTKRLATNLQAALSNRAVIDQAIGIVMSRFNPDACEGLLTACVAELTRLGVAAGDIEIATVPGALEIPLVLQNMAQSDRFDALIALGAVIRGETYHFEVVSNDSCRAVMDVQLDTGIPVANGILTCEDDDQALARMQQKGTDCAQAAVEMANLLRAIGERPQ